MTTKQKQCLLEYLGYYETENSPTVNNVDTLWGDQSEAATRKFQSDYGLDVDGVFGPATEKRILEVVGNGESPVLNWDEIKYFTREEFRCKCGGKYCDGFSAEPSPKLVRVADRVREHLGASALVSSGVRCETHNANVGGVPSSRHLYGKAMDFCIVGHRAAEVLAYVQAQPEIRYSYAIDSNYVHMDVE